MTLLYGANEDVCAWVSNHFYGHPDGFEKDAKAIGVIKDNKLIGAMVYTDFKCRPNGKMYQCEASGISLDRKWLKRYYLREFFAYPFIQLDLERVQMFTSVNNEGVNRVVSNLGFKQEGLHRQGYPLGGDAISWAMLKDECEWIK